MTTAPDSLPPPVSNEAGTVYGQLWHLRFAPKPGPKRRVRRKART